MSTLGSCGSEDADTADKGGGASVFGVGSTRIVLGAERLIGEPVDVAAGLGGTELLEASEIVRGFLAWLSFLLELNARGGSCAGNLVAAAISSLPGCCRLEELPDGVVSSLGIF